MVRYLGRMVDLQGRSYNLALFTAFAASAAMVLAFVAAGK
jgi:hypothetical protein